MSSSRTAVPLAQAAHSGLTRFADGTPNTVAASLRGWPSAMSRADTTAWRLIAAIATAALSMMRLTIIAATSFSTGDLVGGDGGNLPGELVLALQVVLRRVHFDVVQDHAFPPMGRGQAGVHMRPFVGWRMRNGKARGVADGARSTPIYYSELVMRALPIRAATQADRPMLRQAVIE